MALDLHERLTVLRDLMLGDVHAAHDLQAGDDGVLQLCGHGEHAAQQAVDTHTHDHLAVLRLQMDIARALGKGALDEAVDKADGRRAVAGACRFLRHLRGDDILRGRACLALHLLDDAGRALAAVQTADGLLGRAARGDHRDDAAAGGGLDLLLRDEVQRVAHGKVQRVLHELDGHDTEPLGDVLRHILCKLDRDGHRRQVDKLDTKLNLQGLDQVLLGDKLIFDQHIAKALLRFLLQLERLVQLLIRDDAGGDQQVAQTHICHSDPPRCTGKARPLSNARLILGRRR